MLNIVNKIARRNQYQYFLVYRDQYPPSPDEFFYGQPVRESHRCCASECYSPVLVKRCLDYSEKLYRRAVENPLSKTRSEDSSQRLLRVGLPAFLIKARMIVQAHQSSIISRKKCLAHVSFTVKCISNNITHCLRANRFQQRL